MHLIRSIIKKSLFDTTPYTQTRKDRLTHLATITPRMQDVPHHNVSYDYINDHGTHVHVAEKAGLKRGMKVVFKPEGKPKKLRGKVIGWNDTHFQVEGNRQGHVFKPETHEVTREQVWTEDEHAAIREAERTRKTDYVKTSKERLETAKEKWDYKESDIITNPIITRKAKATLSRMARTNGYKSPYTLGTDGTLRNEDQHAAEMYSEYIMAAMNALRGEMSKAPEEDIEQFRKQLAGEAADSRIGTTIGMAGKGAALRYVMKTADFNQKTEEYDSTAEGEHDEESGRMKPVVAVEHFSESEERQNMERDAAIRNLLNDIPVEDADIISRKFALGDYDYPQSNEHIAAHLRTTGKRVSPTDVGKMVQDALERIRETRGTNALRVFIKSAKGEISLKKNAYEVAHISPMQKALDELEMEELCKSHIRQYTKMDGTVVTEHDDKRIKKHQDILAHENKHGDEVHPGAKTKGDLAGHLRDRGWKEKEVNPIRKKEGATVGKREDAPEHEEIKAKNRDNSALQTAEKSMKKMREDALASDDPAQHLQHVNTTRTNTYTAAVDDYREKLLNHFGHETDKDSTATRFDKDGHTVIMHGDKVLSAGADEEKTKKNAPVSNLTGKKEVASVDTGKKEPKFKFGEGDDSENKAYTAKMHEVYSKYALVEAGDLTTSHTITGHINKAYPQEIQPRERESLSSQMQMANIMNDVKPELFGAGHMAAHGAPIVGKDGAVESGNGRTIALAEAYKRDKAGVYKDWLKKDAHKFGIKPEDVDGMQNPVLVRVRNDDDPNTDRAEFAREANDNGNLGQAPREVAWSDAARIDDDLLKKYTIDEDGEIYNEDNMDFIKGFLGKLGKNEAASLLDSDGDPNKKCIERIQNAIFAKVYGSSVLTEFQAESAKPRIRNVLKALNRCAGDFAQSKEHDDLDVVPDMMEALEYYLSNQHKSKAELEYTLKNSSEMNFTGDAPTFKTDHATNLILAFADRSNSRSKMENVLKSISNEIKTEVASRENPEEDMFSGPYQPKNKEQVVKQALDKVNEDGGSSSPITKSALQPDIKHELPKEDIERYKEALNKQHGGKYQFSESVMPVDKIKPSQSGEDYINDSSKETARIHRDVNSGKMRKEDIEYKGDFLPIVVDENNNIIDGNHRHAAHNMNGMKNARVLVAKDKVQKSMPGVWLLRKSNKNHGYHGHFASAPDHSILPQPMDASMLLPKIDEAKADDISEQKKYIDLFMQQFGGSISKPVSFTDANGKKLTISPRMFKDRKDGTYKIFKNGREQYLLMLAEALKNPTEIWEDQRKKKGKMVTIRKYVATYRIGNETMSGLIVFDLMNGRWEGTSAHQRENTESVRTGTKVYSAIKKSRSLCPESGGSLPGHDVSDARTKDRLSQILSPSKNEINKSLAGQSLAIVAKIGERDGSIRAKRDFIINHKLSSAKTANAISADHNTLQKSELPSDGYKMAVQNDVGEKASHYPGIFILRKSHGGNNGKSDRRGEVPTQGDHAPESNGSSGRTRQEGRREIRKSQQAQEENTSQAQGAGHTEGEGGTLAKAHVAAYDRHSLDGSLVHIREHEDSRVRKYGRMVQYSKNSYDLHKVRRERFGHLPHWNALSEDTRHHILNLEEQTEADHKRWEDKKKEKAPDAVQLPGDKSGLKQQVMFKARLLRRHIPTRRNK